MTSPPSSRRLPRLLATALGLTLLAACGSGGAASDQVTEISVLSAFTRAMPEGEPFYAAVDEFTRRTGIEVRVVEGAEDVPDLYETSVLAGQEPDVVITNLVEKSTGWVGEGVALPVDQYLDEWGLRDRVRPEAVDEWRNADGQVQGFPFSAFTWPFWYNTALLAKAGVAAPPATVDELIDAATKLRAAGIGPLVVGGSDWSGQKLFMQIAQQFLPADAARKRFAEGDFCADPAVMRGIELFVRLRDAGVFVDDVQGYTGDMMNSAYYNGDAAIMSTGSWAFTETPPALAATTTLSGLPVPAGGTYGRPTAMQGATGTGIFLSPKAKSKLDAVRKFVEVMYDPATVATFVDKAGTLPALATDGKLTGSPLLQQAVGELPGRVDYTVMPDTAVPPDKADALIRATAVAYAPGVDARTACGEIDAAYGGN
ncbi:ABC transporter substrate-binding protein [Actinomycetes bacterium KLBMP 9759]